MNVNISKGIRNTNKRIRKLNYKLVAEQQIKCMKAKRENGYPVEEVLREVNKC